MNNTTNEWKKYRKLNNLGHITQFIYWKWKRRAEHTHTHRHRAFCLKDRNCSIDPWDPIFCDLLFFFSSVPCFHLCLNGVNGFCCCLLWQLCSIIVFFPFFFSRLFVLVPCVCVCVCFPLGQLIHYSNNSVRVFSPIFSH